MTLSEATRDATRSEWRALGFYYELCEAPPRWRLVGPRAGLARFAELLDRYVADPRNRTPSEHEHYGPYAYLKVETAAAAAIDADGIRGSLEDLARLRDLVARGLARARAGETVVLGAAYAPNVSHPLALEIRADDFDPANADPGLSAPVGGEPE